MAVRRSGSSASAATSERAFYQSGWDFVRALPTGARRFWMLVVVVGLLAGASAAALIEWLRWVQRFAWASGGESFLAAAQGASWFRRLMVPLSAGVLVTVTSLLVRRPLRGHGTASIIESIWT